MVFPLLAGTIDSIEVNRLIELKKNQELSKYSLEKITKPLKSSGKNLTKDMYETTKAFQIRVAKESQHLDDIYKKKLSIYDAKVRKSKKSQDKVKANFSKTLQKTLEDALNIYLGKPKIYNFDNYNADDGVYITKIGSNIFSISVEIVVKLSEAKKLHKQKKLKYLKPEITLEYTDGNLYISKIEVKYKNKYYPVHIGDLSDYDSKFKLKANIKNTFITWNQSEIKDKKLLLFMDEIRQKKAERYRYIFLDLLKKENQKYREQGLIKTEDGLIWQDNKETKKTKLNWKNAKKYCQNLNLANYNDWKLPTKKELLSIVDKNNRPTIKKGFANTVAYGYWSNLSTVSSDLSAWLVFFSYGNTNYRSKSSYNYVRCVRGR